MHFVCGHQTSQAVQYLWQAGLNAERRGAYQEAIHHLTLGLDQLMTLPATPERDRRELDMLIAMGQPLRVVKGLSSVDVGHVLARACKLCHQVGNKQQLSRALFGLWNFHVTRGELQTAYELAEHLCALRPLRDSRNLGYTLLFRGEFTAAWAHLKRSMTFKDAQHALPRLTTIYLYSYASWNLWLLGYPDQALHKSREALNLAAAQPHPRFFSIALSRAALLHQLRRTAQRVHELAEATVTASRELGDPQRHAMGTLLGGWALAAKGQGAEGLHRMCQGLEAWQATGARLHLPYFLSLLADGYGRIGQAERGLAVLDEALAIMDTSGMHWAAAQVYHTQGALLLLPKETTHHPGEAEACLQQAIDVARQQQAKSLELRATTSLARLWQHQGNCREARALLAPVYGSFTEGFDTADLQEAKTLLDELA